MSCYGRYYWYDMNIHSSRSADEQQCITGQCIVIMQVVYGAGRHIEHIKPNDFSNGLKLNFISQPVYLLAICSVKLSVGLFLLRIAVKAIYRRVIIGIMSRRSLRYAWYYADLS